MSVWKIMSSYFVFIRRVEFKISLVLRVSEGADNWNFTWGVLYMGRKMA